MATSTYVLASTNVSPLILPERTGDMTVRYNIPYTVINTNGTSATGDTLLVSLGVTPASWTVQGAIAYISPAFAGVTSQAGTVSVGTTTNLTAFLASASMFTASRRARPSCWAASRSRTPTPSPAIPTPTWRCMR